MKLKRILSAILAFVMLVGLIPANISLAADDTIYEISDDTVKIAVSGANGGFVIRTLDGDSLIKSDNNKDLLFHRGDYDTSFTSFKVTRESGDVETYIFGGDYGYLGGIFQSDVQTVRVSDTEITSTWSIKDLTFTQTIQLASPSGNEHGTAVIAYGASTSGNEPIKVEARVLFDTAMGDQDYAHYEVIDRNGAYRSIEVETDFTSGDDIPVNFFAYDDKQNPEITAYHIHDNAERAPYRMSIAHWNSLASTMFDEFVPTAEIAFSNVYNPEYYTADSAVAMFYNMGDDIVAGSDGFLKTYYGVYSNKKVEDTDSVAINITAPSELKLNSSKTAYLPSREGLPEGQFEIQAQFSNFVSETARDYGSVIVAAYASGGIYPLDANGNLTDTEPSYLKPHTLTYTNFTVGSTQTDFFRFKADVGEVSEYRKIEFRVFNSSDKNALTMDKLIGSKSFYILCYGADGKLPEISFTSMKPNIVYNEGQRNFFISGRNFSMLENKAAYELKAVNIADNREYYIDEKQFELSQEEGTDALSITLTDDNPLPLGTYKFVFDWISEPYPAGYGEKVTAPNLQFTVSDNVEYKNNYYGVMAVVEETDKKYEIKMYKNEEAFQKDKGKYEEVLLTFRGDFLESQDGEGNIVYKATSLKTGKKAQNVIVVNDCIDFENGVLTLKKKTNSVIVDFDGDIYTSIKRSKIWSGEATFTELENGKEFGLVPYNNDGDRIQYDYGMDITLLWPCGLSVAQTISGMAFNMTFGSMGIVYDTDSDKMNSTVASSKVLGQVISFSASLDLSFLIPRAGKSKRDEGWEIVQRMFGQNMTSTELRDKWNGIDMVNRSWKDLTFKDNRSKEGQGSVMVYDILYGCGEGLMGVNFDVELTLPGYFDAMPSISGRLAVNTIGGYKVGVDGLCQFGSLAIEASIAVKEYKGAPIPDKLYFAIMGFEPGINIDGFGVLWITGGGGGIDKLYDTIFGGSKVPPLKILLTVSFDILKTLGARVDMGISLRGLSLTARDVRVKYVNIPVINKLQLAFEWYPDFYFMAAVNVDIIDVLKGSGYIVIMKSEQYKALVEFFVRATVSIPSKIPIIGGLDIAGADLGANNEKIWGVVRALGAELGITYWWGGSVDFGTGSSVSKPSFPELLGYEDVPVYYDEETGRTLYMRGGSNLREVMHASAADEDTPMLMGTHSVRSNITRDNHEINLDSFSGTKSAVVLSFDATSRADALSKANGFVMTDKSTTLSKAINIAGENGYTEDTANANLVYDTDTGKAKLNIVFSKPEEFGTSYSLTTAPTECELALYDIEPMPSLELSGVTQSSDKLEIGWTGTKLDELDSVSFMLTTSADLADTEATSYPLGVAEYTYLYNPSNPDYTRGEETLAIPADLPSGTYYLKAIYSKEDYLNNQVIWSAPIAHVNNNTPTAPSAVRAINSGNNMFDIELDYASASDCDGYIVNVYAESDGSWVLTDVNNVAFEKDEKGVIPSLTVGGYYDVPQTDSAGNPTGASQKFGIEPGKEYKIGVTAFRNVIEGEKVTAQVMAAETMSAPTALKAPTPPTVTVVTESSYKPLEHRQVGVETPSIFDTIASSDAQFKFSSNVAVSGTWTLNDSDMAGFSGSFTNKTALDIDFTDLADGDYKLSISGEDADGDIFHEIKSFTIDTKPPVLLISSPVGGGYFEDDGTIHLTGISDMDAKLNITVDGVAKGDGETIAELASPGAPEGQFVLDIPGKASRDVQLLTISAEDEMGNKSDEQIIKVYNKGLTRIKDLSVYVDDRTYSNGNIINADLPGRLSLGANTTDGKSFLLSDDSLIDWSINTVMGEASIASDGTLSATADSMGTVNARFHVASIGSDGITGGYTGAMTASASFGNANNPVMNELKELSVSTTTGGTVSGAGIYKAGDTVNLIATPNTGYVFAGWTLKSGTLPGVDLSKANLSFTMPANGVSLEARFTQIVPDNQWNTDGSGGAGGSGGVTVGGAGQTSAIKGQLYSFSLSLPNSEGYAPYYIAADGSKKYAPISAQIGSRIYFIAPEDGTYFLEQRYLGFVDIGGHWAEKNIIYAAARNIFNGVSYDRFAPDDNMTRAMFVTVLGRLSGVDVNAYNYSSFADIPMGEWYTPYIAWAAQNGIVLGYDEQSFGPNDPVTREQMCAIILRYIQKFGYTRDASVIRTIFNDEYQIGDWAKEAVAYCQTRGLILGKTGGIFAPQDMSTRAEVATLMKRLVEYILKTKI